MCKRIHMWTCECARAGAQACTSVQVLVLLLCSAVFAFPCKGCASSLHSMYTTVYRGKLKHLQTGGRRSRTEAGTDTRTSMYTCACARFLFNSTWLLMGKAEEQGAQRVWNSKAQGNKRRRFSAPLVPARAHSRRKALRPVTSPP